MKILYIIGDGRSGTTLLARLLGELNGAQAAGELVYIWSRGILQGWPCTCRKQLTECPYWGPILDHIPNSSDPHAAMRLEAMRTSTVRTRHLPLFLHDAFRRGHLRRHFAYVQSIRQLYSAVEASHGPAVLIDTSKRPAYGMLLEYCLDEQVFFLQLVRDPRGVTFSRKRRKLGVGPNGESRMRRTGTMRSSLIWLISNLAASVVIGKVGKRGRRIRYEDFVADPAGAVNGIADWLGLPNFGEPFGSSLKVELASDLHMVSGNPNRFETGETSIRADDAWRTMMPAADAALSVVLTWPLLVAYGYPFVRAGVSTEGRRESP